MVVILSEVFQKVSDYCRDMSKDSRLDSLDVVSTSFCRTPLHIAVMSGDIKLATKILSLKPHLAMTIDSNGFTPIHLASVRTNLQMVKLLVKATPGACVVQDEDGRTPLHLAAMKDRVEIMKLLLEDGLPDAIHIKNDQETILHLCVKSNSTIETLELLVNKLALLAQTPFQNSISVNSKDSDDKTILQLAAEMGKIEMMQYLLQSSNIKFEVNDVKEALKKLSPDEKNDLKIGFPEYSRHGNNHKNTTLSKNNDQHWHKERLNTLMVVATLIAGIAFQATLNPPGGFWQDDTKIDSGTDPVTFTYYLDHLFGSAITGSLEAYMQDYLEHTTIPRNKGSDGYYFLDWNGAQKKIKDFVEALMNSPDFSRISKGLILEDFNLTSVVSNYNNSIGGGVFSPYLIRYAGHPILAYTNRTVYTFYMNTNTVAFLLSVMLIILVLSGIVNDNQLRPLVALMYISTLCIGISYWAILYTMTPGFYVKEPTIYSLYGYFGLFSFYGIIVFIQILISRMDKLKNKHIIGFNYLAALLSMNPITAGKLIIFIFGYCVTNLQVLYSFKSFVLK